DGAPFEGGYPGIERERVVATAAIEVAGEAAPGRDSQRDDLRAPGASELVHGEQVALNTLVRAACREIAVQIVDATIDEHVAVALRVISQQRFEAAAHLVHHFPALGDVVEAALWAVFL